MNKIHFLAVAVGTFLSIGPAFADPDPPVQEGVEVLARGPVHEAYAEPAAARPRANPIIAREPPRLIEEMPADQKPDGDNVQWIPGYWAWDDDRTNYLWVSGFWRVPPPDRRWMPGHWNQIADGWQWVPGFWAMPEAQHVSYLPAPPETLDAGPSVPAPGTDYSYVPGTWVYRDTRYLWRAGFWCPCRPNWVWVPAHYVWSPCGYVFVDGYWDYPLAHRGVLFAPVAFNFNVCYRPGWCYRPCYAVPDTCLLGALFVGPSCGSYFFGDYFGVRYTSLGFNSFLDIRIGGGCYDPLFSYYRWSNRGVGGWEVGMRGLYVGRFNGSIPVPPRTLVQQTTLVNNITNVTNINKTVNVNNVTMIRPLAQMESHGVKLRKLPEEQRLAELKSAREIQAVSVKRREAEREVLAKAPAGGKIEAPRVAHLDLPRARVAKPHALPPPPPVKMDVRIPTSPAHEKPKPIVGEKKEEKVRSVKPTEPAKPQPTPKPKSPPSTSNKDKEGPKRKAEYHKRPY